MRKWPGKRRNPSLDDSNERKSLTVCYTHKYVRLRQKTGPVTTRDNEQETDNCSFAGQLTTVTPSLGNNYTGPESTQIHIHRWGEETDITRGIETDRLQHYTNFKLSSNRKIFF
jgi:hypothetical protein